MYVLSTTEESFKSALNFTCSLMEVNINGFSSVISKELIPVGGIKVLFGLMSEVISSCLPDVALEKILIPYP